MTLKSDMPLSPHNVTSTVIVILVTLALFLLIYIFKIKPRDVLSKIIKLLTRLVGKKISRLEANYERGVQIGRIGDNSHKAKRHQKLNDLIIDLGLKKKGVTPYELYFFTNCVAVILSLIFGMLLFGSLTLSAISYLLIMPAIMSALDTKANVAHDNRIEDVMLAENIISNIMFEMVMVI